MTTLRRVRIFVCAGAVAALSTAAFTVPALANGGQSNTATQTATTAINANIANLNVGGNQFNLAGNIVQVIKQSNKS